MDKMDGILTQLKPADLYPEWRCINELEQRGEISAEEAQRLKRGIFEMMDTYRP